MFLLAPFSSLLHLSGKENSTLEQIILQVTGTLLKVSEIYSSNNNNYKYVAILY